MTYQGIWWIVYHLKSRLDVFLRRDPLAAQSECEERVSGAEGRGTELWKPRKPCPETGYSGSRNWYWPAGIIADRVQGEGSESCRATLAGCIEALLVQSWGKDLRELCIALDKGGSIIAAERRAQNSKWGGFFCLFFSPFLLTFD